MDARQSWVLDEHRLEDGTAVLPGLAYLDLMTGALPARQVGQPVEIRGLTLVAPLPVPDLHPVDAHVTLEAAGNGWRCTVSSGGAGRDPQDHARGDLEPIEPGEARRLAVADLVARCPVRPEGWEPGTQATKQGEHLSFGPRWGVLRELHLGMAETVAVCELPPAFAGDLATCRAHAALLDVAVHAGLLLLPGYESATDLFVPFSFGVIRQYAAIPARIVSHVRLNGMPLPSSPIVTFDVTIADGDGRVLMEIGDFSLRRLAAHPSDAAALTHGASRPGSPAWFTDAFERGIGAEEGADALCRILTRITPPCIVASSIGLDAIAAAVDAASERPPQASAVRRARTGVEEPHDAIERFLCDVWTDLLGLETVGVTDDFFDLGGHSLIAVRLFSRIKSKYRVEFGLAVLFEAPTIAKCAARIRRELELRGIPDVDVAEAPGPGASSSAPAAPFPVTECLVPIRPGGTRRPLFLMPGWGGNVVGFHSLARQLDSDQPVIGLQSRGLDGRHAPFGTMQEIAAHFIAQMKLVQPAGPYLMAGYSFGGMVGYEVSQQLRAAGETVGLLALFDTMLEDVYLGASTRWSRWWSRLGFLRRRVMFHGDALLTARRGPRLEYVRRAYATMRRRMESRSWQRENKLQEVLERLESGVAMDLPAAYRAVKESNLLAIQQYRPRPYPGDVVLFYALDRGLAGQHDSVANWRLLVGNGLTVHYVPGDHLTMFHEPHSRVFMAKFVEVLRAASDASALADQPPPGRPHDHLVEIASV